MPNAGDIFYQFHEGIQEGKRPPLVLIHGSGGSHLYWHSHIRRLAGYCVYALDLPGHGKSGGSGEQRIQTYAEIVRECLLEIGLHNAVIAGHSMGGAVALTLALDDPDHVTGLVMVSSGAVLSVEPALLEQTASSTTYYNAVQALVSQSFATSTPEELRDQAAQRLAETRHSVLHGDLTACRDFNRMEDLPSIQVPTLIISGEEDALVSTRHARYLEDHIPGSQLAIIPNAGHMVVLEQPQQVASTLLNFLNQIPY